MTIFGAANALIAMHLRLETQKIVLLKRGTGGKAEVAANQYFLCGSILLLISAILLVPHRIRPVGWGILASGIVNILVGAVVAIIGG